VGVAVGGVVLIALLAALIVFLVKRNRKAKYRASKRSVVPVDFDTEMPGISVAVKPTVYSAFKDAGIAHDQNIRFRKEMEVSFGFGVDG
jgi:hypothetical protein